MSKMNARQVLEHFEGKGFNVVTSTNSEHGGTYKYVIRWTLHKYVSASSAN